MLQRRLRSLRALNPSSLAQLGKDMQFTADIYPLGIARYMVHARGTERFFTDAEQGTLPAFSIVDPDFKAYSEENPHDIQQGESFASEVIKRVMHGKGWANTLLIWLYDEHGGYYDHVPPPPAVEPDEVLCRSVLSHGTWQHAVLRVLAPGYVKKAQELDAGPPALRPLRLPGPGGHGLALCPPRLRELAGFRPHLHTQAGRAEVEPAPADRAGRCGSLAARRPRLR